MTDGTDRVWVGCTFEVTCARDIGFRLRFYLFGSRFCDSADLRKGLQMATSSENYFFNPYHNKSSVMNKHTWTFFRVCVDLTFNTLAGFPYLRHCFSSSD
jgi:hypothetical protein